MSVDLRTDNAFAIVGMACEYPDAKTPDELWDNVLACRRSFRQIPRERLSVREYAPRFTSQLDTTYISEAAVIEGYHFDRQRFAIPASTYRSTDMTHWLALDVAARTLENAGFPGANGLDRASTGVIIGNTLAGEFSRAGLLRLRWPWVERILREHIGSAGLGVENHSNWFRDLEALFKAPFPASDEDSLAGGLSNTIAGRISNYFDLNGGNFAVDGACASSLIAINQACSALRCGDLSAVLVGGVDLSIDPFELIGFASVGALASKEMQIYSEGSSGFLPGEGCGMILIMRAEVARAHGARVLAWIRGCGISSDGHGSMTRPKIIGQELSLRRAYCQAGLEPNVVSYVEGHGTGTQVGDRVEVEALNNILQKPMIIEGRRIALGSIKANIGHTKAAAGMAGLIKVVMALSNKIIPPTTGWKDPIKELRESGSKMRLLRYSEPWPSAAPPLAGVSAFGFGGINAHIILQGEVDQERRTIVAVSPRTEEDQLIVLDADTPDELVIILKQLAVLASRISIGQMGDFALDSYRLVKQKKVRSAMVVRHPKELAESALLIVDQITKGCTFIRDRNAGRWFAGETSRLPLAFLFPGQGGGIPQIDDSYLVQFPDLARKYEINHRGHFANGDSKRVQQQIISASLFGMDIMSRCRVSATAAVGHSLGEFAALAWSRAMSKSCLLSLIADREALMNNKKVTCGLMAVIGVGVEEVSSLLNNSLVISAVNSPRQTVISGIANAVRLAVESAKSRGWSAAILITNGAFHSPLYKIPAKLFAKKIANGRINKPQLPVISTVSAAKHGNAKSVRSSLSHHMTLPVRWHDATQHAIFKECIMVELGCGNVLSDLIGSSQQQSALPLNLGRKGNSFQQILGAAWAQGQDVDFSALSRGRHERPIDLSWKGNFFKSPCGDEGKAEAINIQSDKLVNSVAHGQYIEAQLPRGTDILIEKDKETIIACLKQIIAKQTHLPVNSIKDSHRLLGDLHLGSLAVGVIVAEVAQLMGISALVASTEFSVATVEEIAEGLLVRSKIPNELPAKNRASSWIRAFTASWHEEPQQVAIQQRSKGVGSWTICALPWAKPAALNEVEPLMSMINASGLLLWMLPGRSDENLSYVLEVSGRVQNLSLGSWFIIIQHVDDWSAWVRNLHADLPHLRILLITIASECADLVQVVIREILTLVPNYENGTNFYEVRFDGNGKRWVRNAKIWHAPATLDSIIGPNDHVLFTGGGKGIGAECALALASSCNCRIILCGRSSPSDPELKASLVRLAKAGVKCTYLNLDITDLDKVHSVLSKVIAEVGPITAIVHAAGINNPSPLQDINLSKVKETIAVKVDGLNNILSALDPTALRLVMGFGSIISEIGLLGEADYALANAWLADAIDSWILAHPLCRGLTVSWSVWSGVGMGTRIANLEALRAKGIHPISVEDGVRWFKRLLIGQWPSRIVITGAFGTPKTFRYMDVTLPLWRFLEEPLVFVPECELVVECRISAQSDPYLNDHCLNGTRLFPAVMVLESMAQAALAVCGETETTTPIEFEDVCFLTAITVPDKGIRIRIEAIVHNMGAVEVTIFSEESQFQVEHVRGMVKIRPPKIKRKVVLSPPNISPLQINPLIDLYDVIAFQGGRFQRVNSYDYATAKFCGAHLSSLVQNRPWFDPCLPQTLVLPDPAARDAVLHGLQVCVPQATILPIRIQSLLIAPEEKTAESIRGAEYYSDGKYFNYDIDVISHSGAMYEQWRGVEFQAINIDWHRRLSTNLLAIIIERRLQYALPVNEVRCAVTEGQRDRRSGLLHSILGVNAVWHGGDGRPLVKEGALTLSHSSNLSLGIIAKESVSCDLAEIHQHANETWKGILGELHNHILIHLIETLGESKDFAGTRLWAARESLVKLGISPAVPMIVVSKVKDDAVLFRCGKAYVLTFPILVNGSESPTMVAVGLIKILTDSKEGYHNELV